MKETKKQWDSTKLRRPFQHANKIDHNYAQSDQDIFVLSMLNGLCNGTYLEIGAGWPEHISNTALLERNFGWTGISIDYLDEHVADWAATNRTLTQTDALYIDYTKLMSNMPKTVDYLSVDCDPGEISLAILKRLPFDQYRFKIITFEHECYTEGPAVKLASREFLTSQGYQLVVSNVSHLGISVDYEDWWCHPDLVDVDRFQLHRSDDDSIKNYQTYFYK
jgi:hypothetical protein